MAVQKTYNYNGIETDFSQLPKDVQKDIKQAEDFYDKMDKASSHEERAQICQNHPYNQL